MEAARLKIEFAQALFEVNVKALTAGLLARFPSHRNQPGSDS
jgi:hypothetical protein